ncbi:glutathione S-transferase family protein [Candidatus Uabimicrobium amorphum]|uniref:glutathione transferase n=1 Tax=Uabimicrobium amorphum TaxID=2596890 RepID=A0A5S9IU30_UABAM|nr:glutathione S-transferase [Candidatus Uabimicrobium amorphum]BBM87170.1 putative GST-like protein YibF [Candidatus Uabimicrobium amorphum]
MRLYGTPLSHFTRKIRILLLELEVHFEFVDIGNVGDNNIEVFSGNPLMRVPILEDNHCKLFESDNIARHIVKNYASEDQFGVCNCDPQVLNILAVISGVMEAEVRLILAERGGMKDIYQHHFFQKTRDVAINGLEWLARQDKFINKQDLCYGHIASVCMWDHLSHYNLFDLTPYAPLKQLSEKWNKKSSFMTTRPKFTNEKNRASKIR